MDDKKNRDNPIEIPKPNKIPDIKPFKDPDLSPETNNPINPKVDEPTHDQSRSGYNEQQPCNNPGKKNI